jgi:hypothetical protein
MFARPMTILYSDAENVERRERLTCRSHHDPLSLFWFPFPQGKGLGVRSTDAVSLMPWRAAVHDDCP